MGNRTTDSDKTVKVAITTPLRERELVDEVAARHGMNRSQFYTRAAERYRSHLAREDLDAQVAEINEFLEAVGQPEGADVVDASMRALAQVEW